MAKPAIADILKWAAEQPSVEETVTVLETYRSESIGTILGILWNPDIQFHEDIKSFDVSAFDFTKNPQSPGSLYGETRRLYLFLENAVPVNLTTEKRQKLWVEFLYGLSPQDAELMVNLVKKYYPSKRISRHVTRKAYPDFMPEEVSYKKK